MKLKRYSPSMSEIEYTDGTRVLFSYETPVAAHVNEGDEKGGRGWVYVKSDRFFSRTTAAHVGKWLRACNADRADTVPHEEIVALAEGR